MILLPYLTLNKFNNNKNKNNKIPLEKWVWLLRNSAV